MDPASLATVTAEVYKVGGILAVMLFIICVAAIYVWKFLMKTINELGRRITEVEKEKTAILVGNVSDSTEAQRAVAQELRVQTGVLQSVADVLRGRPCLLPTDRYEKRPSAHDLPPIAHPAGTYHQQRTPR
jgi:hypothetical protein